MTCHFPGTLDFSQKRALALETPRTAEYIRALGPLRLANIDNYNRGFFFLAILVLAAGATLAGLRVGGTTGMIATGASTLGLMLGIAIGANRFKKYESDKEHKYNDIIGLRGYTPEELILYMQKTSKIALIMDGLNKDGMVSLIDYLSKHHEEIEETFRSLVYGFILQAKPRSDIPGKIYSSDKFEHGTTWESINNAVVEGFGGDTDVHLFCETILHKATLRSDLT